MVTIFPVAAISIEASIAFKSFPLFLITWSAAKEPTITFGSLL